MADGSVIEGSPVTMRVGEAMAWAMDFADQGTPSAVNGVVCLDASGTDKSSTLLSGSASIAGAVVTLPKFTPASAQVYRLRASVTIEGNTLFGVLDVQVLNVSPAVTISHGYATLAEFRAYAAPFGKTDSADDEVIADILEGASRWIDDETRTTFYARSETRYYDIPDGREISFDDYLLSCTSVVNGDGSTISAGNYALLPLNYLPKTGLRLKQMSTQWWLADSSGNTEGVIAVTGTWGYSSTTLADIHEACLMIALAEYQRRFGENLGGTATITAAGVVIASQAAPSAAREIVDRYTRKL